MSITAVVNIGQLLTCDGGDRPRTFASLGVPPIPQVPVALLLEGDRILGTFPERTLDSYARRLGTELQHIDAGGALVTPGFVDAHTHLVFGGDRVDEYEMRAKGATYEEIAQAGGGILSTVKKTREAEDLLAQAKKHSQMMLACGTTTAEAKSGYGLTTEHELRLLKVAQQVGEQTPLRVIPTLLAAHAVPPEYADRAGDYIDLICQEMIPKAREMGVKWCDAFCETIAFSQEDVRRLGRFASEQGMGLRLHVDQLGDSGGAQLAADLFAKTADHLEYASAEGIAALAEAKVMPVLLPGSVYALGKTKYPDARAMIDAGLAVVLASDFNPGSSPTPSMPFILSLACTHMKMAPAEAWNAATWNAAWSLNLQDEVGSLTPGKRADFVIWDADDYREVPYFVGANLVKQVFVGGKRVV